MGLEALIDRFGENGVLALAGLAIGFAFGFLAQRSRFCLRSAVIEFARNVTGGRLTRGRSSCSSNRSSNAWVRTPPWP